MNIVKMLTCMSVPGKFSMVVKGLALLVISQLPQREREDEKV